MVKAAVLGASGGIGQPLSLLLKASPLIDELALYDVVNTPGVAADLSHINTNSTVAGYLPADDGLQKALTGADVVIIPAGMARKPGQNRDDLFKINAGIVYDLVTGVAEYSPRAYVLIISNPVNSTVPIAAKVLKKAGVFNPKKLFGVTTLDVVRASTFAAQAVGAGAKPTDYKIPVIGGHSGETIVPLLGRSQPPIEKFVEESESTTILVKRIQKGGDEVVSAKAGLGSATLSMAYAGFRFAESLLKASTQTGIVEPTFIHLSGVEGGKEIVKEIVKEILEDVDGVEKILKDIDGEDSFKDAARETKIEEAVERVVGDLGFFAVGVALGPEGAVKAINPFTKDSPISATEKALLVPCVNELKKNVKKGIEFTPTPPSPSKL